MKRSQQSFVIRALVFVVTLCSFIVLFYLKETKNYQRIPLLEFRTLPGDSIKISNFVESHSPCVFVFFHPECSHCRDEMDDIMSTCLTNEEFKWFFITTASPSDIELMLDLNLQDLPNNVFFISEEDNPQSHIIFDISSPPAVFLYNEKGMLKWHRKGEMPKGLVSSIINKE